MIVPVATAGEITLNHLFQLPDERFNLKVAGDDQLKQAVSGGEQALERIQAAGWSPVRAEVGRRAGELLDLSVTSMLTGAWNQFMELRQYTDKNAYPPGYSSFVSLSDHSFTFSYSPSIQLLVDGSVVKTFALEVSADIKVMALELEIRDGKIMSVTSGALEGAGGISVGNVLVWTKDFDRIDLPGTVHLGAGFALPTMQGAS